MDARHFDTLTRRFAAPTTRRTALGAAAAGGLLRALGLGHAAPEALAQGRTCTLDFVASIRLGPSAQRALAEGAPSDEVNGELSFALSDSGSLENGVLLLSGGEQLAVVGQATGHSLQLRIVTGERAALIAVGVGEREIAACRGAVDGLATGPMPGDLGDWHAVAKRQGNGDAGGAGGNGGGSSQCATGHTRCGTDCVDLKIDRQHCGACDNFCPDMGGLVCAGGQCACPSGWVDCSQAPGAPQGIDGYCANLTDDPRNCGACGVGCAGGARCANGRCQGAGGAQCAPGLTDCGGLCVDLASDMNNCGACDAACESGLVAVECRAGVCERANCPVGLEYCGAADGCRDLTQDIDHCGACQYECGFDQNCENGVCVMPRCPAGTTDCGGYCVDLMTSVVHCGTCGVSCADLAEICQGGVCVANPEPCAPELSLCGALCVDLSIDPRNCGACAFDCGDDACFAGACAGLVQPPDDDLACAAIGLTNCFGVCSDLMTDAIHCGSCVNSCATGPCVNGACT
jgi:hypothetical protein